MRRHTVRFSDIYCRKTKPMTDEEIATRYEAITDLANIPPPDEVAALCVSTNARTRILSHAEAVKSLHPYNLPPKEK